MKLARIGVILGLILSLILCAIPAMASGKNSGPNQDNTQEFAADRILVKFKADTDQATKHQIHGRHGGTVIDEIPGLDVQVVKIPAGKEAEEVLSISEMGHFLNRTLWDNQAALASSLRPRL